MVVPAEWYCLLFTSLSNNVDLPAFQITHNVHLGEPAHVIKKRSISQRLRIHVQYDDSIDALNDDRKNLIVVRIIYILLGKKVFKTDSDCVY